MITLAQSFAGKKKKFKRRLQEIMVEPFAERGGGVKENERQ